MLTHDGHVCRLVHGGTMNCDQNRAGFFPTVRIIRQSICVPFLAVGLGCAATGGEAENHAARPDIASATTASLSTSGSASNAADTTAGPADSDVGRLNALVAELQTRLAGEPIKELSSDSVGVTGSAHVPSERPEGTSISSAVPPLGDPAVPTDSTSPPAQAEGINEQPSSSDGWAGEADQNPRRAGDAINENAVSRIIDRLQSDPHSPAGAFDHQLLQMLAGGEIASVKFTALRPEDERILAVLAKQIGRFRDNLRMDATADAAKRIEPIIEAAMELRREAGLSLPTIALCSEVRMFGSYVEVGPRFEVGKSEAVVLYVEVDNFQTAVVADGWYETRLTLSAVLYDPDGKPVMSLAESPITDRSRRQRRDFFLCGQLRLPGATRPGLYVLKVTVNDQLSERVAQESMRLTFTPPR